MSEQTIADMLSMYMDVKQKTGDTILRYATFAYKTAVQWMTSFTPFCLVHGQEATTTLSAYHPGDNDNNDYDAAAIF